MEGFQILHQQVKTSPFTEMKHHHKKNKSTYLFFSSDEFTLVFTTIQYIIYKSIKYMKGEPGRAFKAP